MFEDYYAEFDPIKRKEILDGLLIETPDSNVLDQIKMLFDMRYTPNQEIGYADRFIQILFEFKLMANKELGILLKKKNEKQLREAMHCLCLDRRAEFCDEVLYREMCHLVMVYVSLCQKDHRYNAVIFGLGTISNEAQTKRVTDDLTQITEIITQYSELEDNYKILQEAIAYVQIIQL